MCVCMRVHMCVCFSQYYLVFDKFIEVFNVIYNSKDLEIINKSKNR